jgi:hypothetical protein
MKHCIIHPSEYYEATCPSCDRERASSSLQPAGSDNSSDAKDALKKEIARIIDDAFTAGFDADNAGALDHFDGFALADASIEKYWPNEKLRHGGDE